jgi:hypothetical protein
LLNPLLQASLFINSSLHCFEQSREAVNVIG